VAGPPTNDLLSGLLREAGYQNSMFARQVNHAGTHRNVTLTYDGASVYWWLRGRVPSPPVPELICGVLSRRIGREISRSDLGFDDARIDVGLQYVSDPREARDVVARFWRAASGGDGLGGPVVEGATARAAWKWHFGSADPIESETASRRVGAGDVARLKELAASVLLLDRQIGGQHALSALLGILHREVSPVLRGSSSQEVARQVLVIAGALTSQLSFLSYDTGRVGLAQRANIQALRMAKASGATQLGAHVLANMSSQAVAEGRRGESVELAQAAVVGSTGGYVHPLVLARIHTAAASAQALTGAREAFHSSIGLAEQALAAGGDHPPPPWVSFFSRAHWAGSAVRGLIDLGSESDVGRYQEQALGVGGSRRTRALHGALLAIAHARAGDLDQACGLADGALDAAEGVRSHRIVRRLARLDGLLRSYRSTPGTQQVLDRLTQARACA
jgi:hypothetical protein